jgi:hypothetical protein
MNGNDMVNVQMTVEQLKFLISLAGNMDFDAINMLGYFEEEADEFFEACEDASLMLSDNYYENWQKEHLY